MPTCTQVQDEAIWSPAFVGDRLQIRGVGLWLCAACSLGAGVGGGFCRVRSIDEGRGAGGDGCQGVIVFFMYSDHQAEEAHADLYAGHGRLFGRWREWTGAG